MKTKDWVALIEAGYSLEGNETTWLKQVLDQAAPLFDGGFWPMIWTYNFTPTTVQIQDAKSNGPSRSIKFLHQTLTSPSEAIDYFYRSGVQISSFSEAFLRWPVLSTMNNRVTGGLVRDALCIKAFTGRSSGLGVSNLFLKKISPTALERKRWPLMASHLGAGLRLRALAESLTLDAQPVEGIFDAGGKLYDARDHAKETSACEALRAAVRRIDFLDSGWS